MKSMYFSNLPIIRYKVVVRVYLNTRFCGITLPVSEFVKLELASLKARFSKPTTLSRNNSAKSWNTMLMRREVWISTHSLATNKTLQAETVESLWLVFGFSQSMKNMSTVHCRTSNWIMWKNFKQNVTMMNNENFSFSKGVDIGRTITVFCCWKREKKIVLYYSEKILKETMQQKISFFSLFLILRFQVKSSKA